MMRNSTLIALAAAAAVTTAGAILLPDGEGAAGVAAEHAKMLPELANGWGKIAAITVTGAGGKVRLEHPNATTKPEEGWVAADKAGYPVVAATIRPVLDGLRSIATIEPKTARPALYSRLELGDPGKDAGSHLVELLGADGAKIAAIVLGRQKSDPQGGAESQYARIPGKPQSWLAGPAITLPDSALGWIEHGIVDLDSAAVKRVVIHHADGSELQYARAKAEDALALQTALPAGRKLKADDHGTEVAGGLAALELTDVRKTAGFTGKDAGSAEYVSFDGLDVTLHLSQADGGVWASVEAKADAGAKDAKKAAEIAARTGGWVYALSDPRAQTLQTKLEDLLAELPKPEAPTAAGKVAKAVQH